MRIIRRIGIAAVAGVLMSAFVSGPAAADTPETYVGSASGKALHLAIAGQEATLGGSFAELDSTLHALATGVGVLGLPVVGGTTEAKAEVTGDSTGQSVPQACATPEAFANVGDVLGLGLGCGSASVQVTGGMPVAHGEATVANINVDGQTVLGTVLDTPIGDVADTAIDTLGGLPVLDSLGLELDDTLGQLVEALGAVRTLEVKLGGSTSDVTVDGSKVISTGAAAGGTISILPLGAVGQKPVAEIVIGSANATAVYDRATGVSTPSFDPAIVTIRINTPTTDALGELTGVNTQEIKISPMDLVNLPATAACDEDPKSVCILKGTPLETRITVASGRTVTNPDGTVGAIADAVAVHALRNIGGTVPQLDGGILLEIAHAEAGVGGQPAQIVQITPPELPRELPRTGGFAVLPMLGGTGLAAAILGRRMLSIRNR
jgi:hypothetical protein